MDDRREMSKLVNHKKTWRILRSLRLVKNEKQSQFLAESGHKTIDARQKAEKWRAMLTQIEASEQ